MRKPRLDQTPLNWAMELVGDLGDVLFIPMPTSIASLRPVYLTCALQFLLLPSLSFLSLTLGGGALTVFQGRMTSSRSQLPAQRFVSVGISAPSGGLVSPPPGPGQVFLA